METMEDTLWAELAVLQNQEVSQSILQKLKNKNESTMCFSNISAAHKATNLAYYESLGDANLINTEADRIADVTSKHIYKVVNHLRKDNVNTMRLIGSSNGEVIVIPDAMDDDEDE